MWPTAIVEELTLVLIPTDTSNLDVRTKNSFLFVETPSLWSFNSVKESEDTWTAAATPSMQKQSRYPCFKTTPKDFIVSAYFKKRAFWPSWSSDRVNMNMDGIMRIRGHDLLSSFRPSGPMPPRLRPCLPTWNVKSMTKLSRLQELSRSIASLELKPIWILSAPHIGCSQTKMFSGGDLRNSWRTMDAIRHFPFLHTALARTKILNLPSRRPFFQRNFVCLHQFESLCGRACLRKGFGVHTTNHCHVFLLAVLTKLQHLRG